MMKDNDGFELMRLEEYQSRASDERARYLDLHVGSSTDLPEKFCLEALRWETSPWPRWYLVRALGLLKSKPAIADLIQICNETDVDFGNTSLHLICAWSLGQSKETALPLVLEALKSAIKPDTKKCLVDALGEIGNKNAIPALDEVFRNDDDGLKLWAALSLSKIGKPALDTLYLLLSQSARWKERVYVLDAICKIKDSSSATVIRNVLYNGSSEEKHFVLARCNECFDDSFREPLELISASESPELSSLARRALAAR